MKVTTEDCVNAIVEHLIKTENNFTNIKDWKRISKKGTGDNIIRKFQNKVSNKEVYVRSNESEILEISSTEITEISDTKKVITSFNKFNTTNEFVDFPFVKVLKYATVYSKRDFYSRDFDFNKNFKADMKQSHYEKFSLPAGTRIGIVEPMNDDPEMALNIIIVVTEKMNYYSYDEGLTCDGIITFEVDDNVDYGPSQEPVDVIENDCFEDYFDENTKTMKKLSKKYKLNHLLCGN